MNSKKIVGVAAAMLAVGVPTMAQAQQADKPLTLRLGAFLPSNSDAKDGLGKTWFTAGLDYSFKNAVASMASSATAMPVSPLAYLDYTGKSKDVDGGKNEASVIALGLGGKYYAPTQGVSPVRPYIGGGLGAYFVHGKSTTTTTTTDVPNPPTTDAVHANATTTTSDTKNQTNFGFKINGGVEFGQNYLIDVAYWNAGKIQGTRIDGYTVSLGYTF